jgi:UDP-glucose 4-epimerase
MIIITGGTGYIGKNIAFYLLQKGEKVLLIDDFSNSTENAMHSLLEKLKEHHINPAHLRFRNLNLTDRQKTNQFFFHELSYLINEYLFTDRVKGVIHCAGHKSVSESVTNPLEYYRNNLISTLNLVECLQIMNKMNEADKIPPIPLIFSSSTTVYGDNTNPLVETMSCTIDNIACPYGKTKYLIEEILRDCSKYISTVSLRYFNPVGCFETLDEEMTEKSTNLIPVLVKSIQKKTVFKVFGSDYNTRDGTCIRDYIDVRDLARAHYLALEYAINMKELKDTKNMTYDVFNLGTEKGTSVKELLETFERVRDIKLQYEYVERRPGDLPECYANSEKAHKLLGWVPEYTLEQSLESIKI